MCGIAGIISLKNPDIQSPVGNMVAQMVHRGPDDSGTAFFDDYPFRVGLGNTRLSILDLTSCGHQPMLSQDEQSSIVYNGEIYNHQSLRNFHDSWRSGSDTETLLELYSKFGMDCLDHLRGMFAFAIWDRKNKKLFAGRDPYGIKPFYYSCSDSSFIFASEVRVFLSSGLVERKLNGNALADYLRYGAVQSPSTIIQNVLSLSPGHWLTVEERDRKLRVSTGKYRSKLPRELNCNTRAQAVAEVESILLESVKAHLLSDVPVAAFLSGGIDSSILVSLINKVSSQKPKTFTVVFSEKDFSERDYARVVAQKFETEHTEIALSEQQLLNMLPDAIAAMDQPTIDGINTYVLSNAVRQSAIKVAISGLGGDELFGGYPSFRRARKLRHLKNVPRPVRNLLSTAGKTLMPKSVGLNKAFELLASGAVPADVYRVSRQLFSLEEIDRLMTDSAFYTENSLVSTGDLFNDISSYEMQGYMANMLLRDTDFMSMANSLEVRVPFVDPVVVSFVSLLPGSWKMNERRPKALLLDAVGKELPEEIWKRPKMGFTLPFQRWMRSALKSELNDTFHSPQSFEQLGIRPVAARCWHTFLKAPSKERWTRPWSLYVLKKWCENNGMRV